jgi:tetratricopeptide (TPR) repeat protein
LRRYLLLSNLPKKEKECVMKTIWRKSLVFLLGGSVFFQGGSGKITEVRAALLDAVPMHRGAGSPKERALSDAVERLQQQVEVLLKRSTTARIRRASALLLRVQALAPQRWEGLVAASRACLLMGFLPSESAKKAVWGRKGLRYAERLMRRWPKRAEGFVWAAVHTGLVAQGINPFAAFVQGLPAKMEKYALQAYRLQPTVYRGAASRLLGRYYFALPWPARNLQKSHKHLRLAYQLDPSDANGTFFLAETLTALGQRDAARPLFRRCAQTPSTHPLRHANQTPARDAILTCQRLIRHPHVVLPNKLIENPRG